jgi:nucleotide-binding universal stress UspA family protein
LSVTRDHEGQPLAEEIVARTKAMLEDLGIQVAGTAVAAGDPVEQIVEAGAKHAVIVVSDTGKSRLKRFLVGSVAFGVMGRATTSVLNVR